MAKYFLIILLFIYVKNVLKNYLKMIYFGKKFCDNKLNSIYKDKL